MKYPRKLTARGKNVCLEPLIWIQSSSWSTNALSQPFEHWDCTWADIPDQHFSDSERSSSSLWDKCFPLAHFPSPWSGYSGHKSLLELEHLRILPSLSLACLLYGSTSGYISTSRSYWPGGAAFTLHKTPHLPSPTYTIILHTAGCAWVCFPFIMSLQFNEGSRAVGGWLPLWTQERRQPTAAPLSCPRRVVTAPLPPPFPNLYSVHSQGHKSVVVGMYYEEINIYHISFQEGE